MFTDWPICVSSYWYHCPKPLLTLLLTPSGLTTAFKTKRCRMADYPTQHEIFPHLKLHILLYKLYMCIIYYHNINFINICISSETPVLRWGYFSPSWFPWRPLWSWRAQGLPVAAHLRKPWSPGAARVHQHTRNSWKFAAFLFLCIKKSGIHFTPDNCAELWTLF